MPKIEYEHTFIQHSSGQDTDAILPIDVASGLTAWGADGWEIVHMEAVWHWEPLPGGASHPQALRGYYVTFKRELEGDTRVATMKAETEVLIGDVFPAQIS